MHQALGARGRSSRVGPDQGDHDHRIGVRVFGHGEDRRGPLCVGCDRDAVIHVKVKVALGRNDAVARHPAEALVEVRGVVGLAVAVDLRESKLLGDRVVVVRGLAAVVTNEVEVGVVVLHVLGLARHVARGHVLCRVDHHGLDEGGGGRGSVVVREGPPGRRDLGVEMIIKNELAEQRHHACDRGGGHGSAGHLRRFAGLCEVVTRGARRYDGVTGAADIGLYPNVRGGADRGERCHGRPILWRVGTALCGAHRDHVLGGSGRADRVPAVLALVARREEHHKVVMVVDVLVDGGRGISVRGVACEGAPAVGVDAGSGVVRWREGLSVHPDARERALIRPEVEDHELGVEGDTRVGRDLAACDVRSADGNSDVYRVGVLDAAVTEAPANLVVVSSATDIYLVLTSLQEDFVVHPVVTKHLPGLEGTGCDEFSIHVVNIVTSTVPTIRVAIVQHELRRA
mmetsp:Transcript_86486/g.244378  ORF Transcript_86486/g.244378 Transcript_86486/m.244378 type:complete len:457 (-) Transcript_86486:1749-3119(-)